MRTTSSRLSVSPSISRDLPPSRSRIASALRVRFDCDGGEGALVRGGHDLLHIELIFDQVGEALSASANDRIPVDHGQLGQGLTHLELVILAHLAAEGDQILSERGGRFKLEIDEFEPRHGVVAEVDALRSVRSD